MGQKTNNTKKWIIIMAIIAIIFFLPTLLMYVMYYSKTVDFGTSGIYQEEEVKKISAEVVDLFTSKSYQEILDDYVDAEAKGDTDEETLENAVDEVNEDWGEYKETESVDLSEIKQRKKYYASSQSKVAYENVTVLINLIFDEDMEIIGLSIQDSEKAEK